MAKNIGSLFWITGIDNTNLRKDAAQSANLLGGVGKSADGVSSQIKEMTAALSKQAQATKQKIDSLRAAQLKLKKAGDTSSSTYIKNDVELKRLNSTYLNQKKAIIALESPYAKLSNELIKARTNAKNLAAQYGINSSQARKAAAGVNKLDKELKDIDSSVGQNQRSVGDYKLALEGLNVQLRKEQSELKKTTSNLGRNNAKTKQARLSIQQLKEQIRQTNNQLNKGAAGSSRYGTALKGLASSFLGITAVVYGAWRGIKKLVTGNIELEEAEANVMKTTGYTTAQVNILTEALKRLDTKTPIEQLLGLAEAGGRLNITGKELEDFVENTDKAFVALGDSLEGEAADIGLTLGKMAGNFDLEEKYGIGEAMNKIGSALNELGASSKASEGPIVDFTQRLAGVSSQAKITLPDIAALGALFDENGQSIEVAATTFNKLLPAIGKDVERFAKIAGLNVKEFKKIVEEDAFEALKLVAIGAKSNEEGLIGLSETLESYGVDSARAASIVGILSSKTERLTELQKISNDAFESGTSLTKEFNIKNETLGSTLSKIGNTLAAKFTGSKTDKFLKGLAEGFFNLVKSTEAAAVATEKERLGLLTLESKLKDVNTSNEERLKLINELKDRYPGLLGDIDAETVSNEQLSTALREVNKQLIQKVVLQEKDSEIAKQSEKIGEKQLGFIKEEEALSKRIGKIVGASRKEGSVYVEKTIKDNASVLDQGRDLLKQFNEFEQNRIGSDYGDLSHAVAVLEEKEKYLNVAEKTKAVLLEERTALKERQELLAGGKSKVVTTIETEAEKAARIAAEQAAADALTKKQIAAAKKTKEERLKDEETFLKDLQNLRDDAAIAALESESEQKKLKIDQDLRDQKLKNKDLKIEPDDLKTLDDAYEKEAAAEKVAIDKEAADKIQAIWKKINDSRLSDIEAEKQAIIDKYAKELELAEKAGDVELVTAINETVTKETNVVTQKYKIDWGVIFGDLDDVSTRALDDLQVQLEEYLSTVSDTISKTDLKTVTDQLEKLKEEIADRTPIKALIESYEDYKKATDDVIEAEKELNALEEEGKESKKELEAATKKLTDAEKDRAESLSKMTKAVNTVGEKGQQLVNAGGDIVNMLEDLGVSVADSTKEVLSGMGQTFDGLASIDLTKPMSIITGGIKALGGLAHTVTSLFGGGAKQVSQKTIDYYNDLMSVMDDVISKHKDLMSELSGANAVDEWEKTTELINKQIEATRELGKEFLASREKNRHSYGYKLRKDLREFKDEFAKLGLDSDDVYGFFEMSPDQLQQIKEEIPKAWAKIDDQTRAYLETIIASGVALDDTAKVLGEALTDLSFDSAKSALKDLLLNTDTTLADISDNFEKYMRNAIVNALINGELSTLLADWYENFTAAMAEDGLSAQEKEDLQAQYANIGQTGLDLTAAAFEAAGIDPTASTLSNQGTTSAGQIQRSLTEDTGSALMGLWRRSLDEQKTQTGIFMKANGFLFEISANTLRTANNTDRLESMAIELKGVNENTKKSYLNDMGL